MNKYQDAFKSISDNQYQYGTDEQWELLESLVDKATPKSPVLMGIKKDPHWRCPNCGKILTTYKELKISNYCQHCGQSLKLKGKL